jgi:uncharacterized membrane protein
MQYTLGNIQYTLGNIRHISNTFLYGTVLGTSKQSLILKNASTAIKTEVVLKISINVISFTFDYYHGNFFQEKDNNYNELNANLTDITLSLPCSRAHDYKL